MEEKRLVMLETAPEPDTDQKPSTMSRRGLLKLGVALNALAGVLLGVPIVGYLASAARKKEMIEALAWIPLGEVDTFPEGETRLATFRNPLTNPWDGETGDVTCWVRRIDKRGVPGLRDQLHAPWVPGAMVPAVGAVHVPLPWRRVLRGRREGLRSAAAGALPLPEQD